MWFHRNIKFFDNYLGDTISDLLTKSIPSISLKFIQLDFTWKYYPNRLSKELKETESTRTEWSRGNNSSSMISIIWVTKSSMSFDDINRMLPGERGHLPTLQILNSSGYYIWGKHNSHLEENNQDGKEEYQWYTIK